MRKQRSTVRKLLLLAVAAYLIFAERAGIATFAVGFGLMLVGHAFQIMSYTVLVKNTELTTQGIYRLVRHPFYVGTMFSDLGICVLSGSWIVTVAYMAIFAFFYIRRIRREEAFLHGQFGEAYEEYRKKTPCFIPRCPWGLEPSQSPLEIDASLILRNQILPRILNLWAYAIAVTVISDTKWGGDPIWSLDHVMLAAVCAALFALSLYLGEAAKRVRKAAAQGPEVPGAAAPPPAEDAPPH